MAQGFMDFFLEVQICIDRREGIPQSSKITITNFVVRL